MAADHLCNLLARRHEEAEAAARIAAMEEEALAAGERCSGLQEEAEIKTKKLKKLWKKYQVSDRYTGSCQDT